MANADVELMVANQAVRLAASGTAATRRGKAVLVVGGGQECMQSSCKSWLEYRLSIQSEGKPFQSVLI